MLPHMNEIHKLLELAGSLWIITGVMAWYRRGSTEEDEVIAQAADELLGAISDADMVSKIQDSTGIDVRDQMSVKDAEDWHRERELRRMKNRN